MERYLAQVRPLRRLRQEPIRGFRLLEGNHCQTSRLKGTKVPFALRFELLYGPLVSSLLNGTTTADPNKPMNSGKPAYG
jgi:hypothetical protein